MIARVTLDRPDTRNALDAELSARLAAGVAEALADDPVRVIVLDHEGSVFSAGADLRALAVKQVERVRSFKRHVAAYLIGMPLVGAVWALTEYVNADGWPERFSESSSQEGTWNPWVLWVLLGWTIALAWHGLSTYFRRPASEQEIARELDRLKSKR